MSNLPLGQLFVFGFEGQSLQDETRALIKETSAGGAILFSRNIDNLEQVVELNGNLIDLGSAEHPFLLSVDEEGGRVARLRHICTPIPTMRRVGDESLDDPDLPYRIGAQMARELSALGFHLDFAPVVDVDTNPQNPVIGDRSFSRDPKVCSGTAVQFIRGMQQGGIAACAKHFPGHGDTASDSHFELPRLPHTLERLDEVELAPFRAACEVDVASVMTAHVLFEALDAEHPATLSKAIIDGVLRQKIGYRGVVISDDLEMAAVADRYEVEEMVERGLRAGVDLFLVCHSPDKQARAVAAAHRLVDEGKIERAQIEGALSRVAKLKADFIGAPARPELAMAKQMVRAAPHVAFMERFADEEISVRKSPVDHA